MDPTSLPPDATATITFGLFGALVSIIGIYQAAKFAATRARHTSLDDAPAELEAQSISRASTEQDEGYNTDAGAGVGMMEASREAILEEGQQQRPAERGA